MMERRYIKNKNDGKSLQLTIFLFIVTNAILLFASCQNTNKPPSNKHTDTTNKKENAITKDTRNIINPPVPEKVGNTNDTKIFNQCDPNCTWHYFYPFADSSYVLAAQNCPEEFIEKGKITRLYFGIDQGLTDKIIWTENIYTTAEVSEIKQEDFNGDGVKDILIFKETGGRGSNEFYYLYLADSKNHRITKVKKIDEIVNPSYDAKNKVVLSYAMAGSNYFSIYKIANNHTIYKIGESFEDVFDGDNEALDEKIEQILNKHQ